MSNLVFTQKHELQLNLLNIHSLSPGSGSISYRYNLIGHSFYGGVKIHYNPPSANKTTSHVFYQNFNADNFGERIGLLGGYEFHIPLKNNIKSSFFSFFEIQYARMGLKGYSMVPNDPNDENVFYRELKISENFNIINWGIGIGLKTNISANLYLTVKVGAGFNHYFNLPINYSNNNNVFFLRKRDWELSYIGSLGISYKFKQKE